jgi:hypothetical protein
MVIAASTWRTRLAIEARRALETPRLGRKSFAAHALAVALETVVTHAALARVTRLTVFAEKIVHAVHALVQSIEAHSARAATASSESVLAIAVWEIAVRTFGALVAKVPRKTRGAPCGRVKALGTDALARALLARITTAIETLVARKRAARAKEVWQAVEAIRTTVPRSITFRQKCDNSTSPKKRIRHYVQAVAASRCDVIDRTHAFAVARAHGPRRFIPPGACCMNRKRKTVRWLVLLW